MEKNHESQSIAARKPRREIRKPLRYADCVDIVDTNSIAYALAIGENIDFDESRS